MKNLTWQNPEQLFVAQELINKVKSKCCGIKDKHIIEVGENIKVVCKRFLDSGMTPEQVAERMDVPMKFVNACIR